MITDIEQFKAAGYYHLKNFNLVEAAKNYESAFAIDNVDVDVVSMLVQIYLNIYDYNRAEEVCLQAIACSTKRNIDTRITGEFQVNLGNVYSDTYQISRAIEAFEAARRNNACQGLIHRGYGDLYRILDDYEDALLEYQLAYKQLPERPDILISISAIYRAMGKLSEARDVIEKAKVAGDFAWGIATEVALVDAAAGDGAAKTHIDELSEGSTEPISSQYYQAYILINQNRCEDAIPILRNILALCPNNIEVLYSLAKCLGDTGNLADATNTLYQLYNISPDFKPAYIALLMLHRRQHQWRQFTTITMAFWRYLKRKRAAESLIDQNIKSMQEQDQGGE